jgi:protein-tyrosine kinase
MGRIEEALAKLRRGAATADDRSRPALGTVRESTAATPRKYGGRFIQLDFNELRARGLLAPDTNDHRLTEEYRAIKRPLLKNAYPNELAPIPRGNVIQIASALPGEGKTFTCLNLCLSLAKEQDWNVVLVDGDCNKPHLSTLFGAEREPGLIGVLRGLSGDFDANVMPTSVPNLAVMPAGARYEESSELLASAAMEQLCQKISSADPKRLIVFDSPPMLLTSEAPAIARHMGQILLVVNADRTPQRSVVSALRLLDATKPIGLVLNQVRGKESHGTYGSNYGYYHGPTASEQPRE